MMSMESLYLAQSYQDAWEDYVRSLGNPSFPCWDYVILTASNEHQAEGFRIQIEGRKDLLPTRTRFVVIPDEGGKRVGSGGSTLQVLRWLKAEAGDLKGKRILVIHSGGDSRRVPQYSALGKLFSPVPHVLPNGRPSTLFDEFLIAMAAVPGRLRDGMLLASGDVLLLFNALLIDYPGHGAAALSFKEKARTGKDHGVFLRGEDGFVKAFLHKQSVETLKERGAVNERGDVDIDTGALIFGNDLLEALWTLISTDDVFDEKKYASLVNEKVRLSLYGDFQYPLAADSTLEQFYLEKPEGDFCPELTAARRLVWEALHPFRLKLLRMAPAKFIHFGTTREILGLMGREVSNYQDLGWTKRANCSMSCGAGYNSVLGNGGSLGEGSYLEVSYVHSGARVGRDSLVSYVEVERGTEIPDEVVLHGLKQLNQKFVCRIFGTGDNPKEAVLFGEDLTGDWWEEGQEHSLWNARLYPECDRIGQAVEAALQLVALSKEGRLAEIKHLYPVRRSLKEGFDNADPEAILAWNKRMEELVAMNDLAAGIAGGLPARDFHLAGPLSPIQTEWLSDHLSRASFSEKMRLHYYVGLATGNESEVNKAFSALGEAILTSSLLKLQERTDLSIVTDEHTLELPLRVNWGGGWSDTPPYCIEQGGTVLNAAILLNGERPVRVTLKRLPEHKVIFESRDMDVYGEFTDLEDLQRTGDPFDPFVLQKAAFIACGLIPAKGGDLEQILTRLGGGIFMDTEVVGVPKGSGLGTSSILAAACVRALFEFLGVSCEEKDLYATVLCMEQIMSTGGGWQDQVGGVTDGIKYISSRPGLLQELKVEHLKLDEETKAELDQRFALIYTGQRRLARNLLRDVVGRYIGNEPESLYALNEIQRVAALMRFELERGHVDDFAALMDRHWELSKQVDAGSTNTLIDQIFDAVDDLLSGRMICGAGGGGFLQVILKKGVSLESLQERLRQVFQDTEIGVWKATLI